MFVHRPAVSAITHLPVVARCVVARARTHFASAELHSISEDVLDKSNCSFHFYILSF